MQTLIALLVAAAAACAIARPPGPTAPPESVQEQGEPQLIRVPLAPSHDYLVDYILNRLILPHRLGYDDSPRVQAPPQHDWLNEEINRINAMEEGIELPIPYDTDVTRWISRDPNMQRIFQLSRRPQETVYSSESVRTSFEDLRPIKLLIPKPMPVYHNLPQPKKREPELVPAVNAIDSNRKRFALTPMDKEYYNYDMETVQHLGSGGGGGVATLVSKASPGALVAPVLEPPRQTRQNPNLSKQKHLLEPDIGKLKIGLSHEEQHTGKQVQVAETAGDPAQSIYSVALIAAVGAALTMAVVGFSFGWYTLSKKAKAAADVDYPAYGVTGPTVDTSGDRKLAHSAHMYHYQHQKQQIIAMERNGLEQRTGSVSDPESEEENEEGDYTVYECPGFATTGDMEVKNPLFSEEPMPTTPGKCEVVKPQPKD